MAKSTNFCSTILIETVIVNLINLTREEALSWVLRILYNRIWSHLIELVKRVQSSELGRGLIELGSEIINTEVLPELCKLKSRLLL